MSLVRAAYAQAPTAATTPGSPEAPAVSGSAPQDARPAPARPSSPTDGPRPIAEALEGDAKREYELGRLLYNNGDFAGALARFQSAAKASDDPRLLWNAAVCQKALRHYAKAITLVRRYLASNSPLITPAAALTARAFLAAAEPLTARLDVSANVAEARVYADDELMGSVPLGADARVDWGAHQVVVKKQDYSDYAQTVTVSSSADVRVSAVLRPVVHEGRVIVRAHAGDRIAVDGVVRAFGTWEGALASGRHTLRVTASGSRPYQEQLVVADAQTRGFDVTLEPAPRAPLPTWLWLAGGTVLAAGAVTAGYFIFKPAAQPTTRGSIDTVQAPLKIP
ncbi:MAG: PEGA domain-containing protein [Polyangiaceae bacterium]